MNSVNVPVNYVMLYINRMIYVSVILCRYDKVINYIMLHLN